MNEADELAQLIADEFGRDGWPKVQDRWLADAVLSSDWLARVKAEAAATALEEAAAYFQQMAVDEQAMVGPARVRLDLLWSRAAAIRDGRVPDAG